MIKSKTIIYEKFGAPLFVDEIRIEDPKPEDVVVKMVPLISFKDRILLSVDFNSNGIAF